MVPKLIQVVATCYILLSRKGERRGVPLHPWIPLPKSATDPQDPHTILGVFESLLAFQQKKNKAMIFSHGAEF